MRPIAIALALLPLLLAASQSTTPPKTAVLLAAGDIAVCGSNADEQTAAILGRYPQATVATLGDNAYPSGSADEYARCFEPSWGAAKSRMRPSPGNHEYRTAGAAGYFAYFGRRAGNPARGWYTYRLGTWRIVALNSNCHDVGGCGPGSDQERWLRDVLRSDRSTCTLAYWHHPRFSSGPHGSDAKTDALWRALYEDGADIVLSGHDHLYERFSPQTPDGAASPRGIRHFVVGTGGSRIYKAGPPAPNSVSRASVHGVLVLTLAPGRYSWRFVSTDRDAATDSGSAACVRRRR